MKSVIHKWQITMGYTTKVVGVPLYSEIRDGLVFVWSRADVDDNGIYVPYNVITHYHVVGTGWEFDPEDVYHKTFFSGPFVWHLMESLTPIERH